MEDYRKDPQQEATPDPPEEELNLFYALDEAGVSQELIDQVMGLLDTYRKKIEQGCDVCRERHHREIYEAEKRIEEAAKQYWNDVYNQGDTTP